MITAMRDCVITQGSKNEIMMTFFAGTIGCDGPKSLLLDFGSYVVKDLTY